MSCDNRRIGSIAIPSLALGTMYFGTSVDKSLAHECLDIAFELGATFWDTANNYAFWAGGNGDESETVIGQWIATRGSAAREKVILDTKVGARPLTGYADLDHVAGLSRAAVRSQVMDSLRRLQTRHLDVLYTHIDDRSIPLAETASALAELVDDGLIREVAVSNMSADRLSDLLSLPTSHKISALQQRFSYLSPDPTADTSPQVVLDDRAYALADAANIAVLGYSPLLSGSYTRSDRPLPGEYRTPRNTTRLEVLDQLAGSVELDRGQLVLAWMTQRRQQVTPIVGVSAAGHVRSAWAACNTPLAADVLMTLDERR